MKCDYYNPPKKCFWNQEQAEWEAYHMVYDTKYASYARTYFCKACYCWHITTKRHF